MRCRLALAIVLFGVCPAIAGTPLPGRPYIVTGDVVTAMATSQPTTQPVAGGVFRYDAIWDVDQDGYVFLCPFAPDGWSLITVDVDGLATIGDATADWSRTPIGNPLGNGSFVFNPVTMDMGTGWVAVRTKEPLLWGFAGGFAIDFLCFTWRVFFGGMWHGVGRMGSGRSAF